MLNQLAKIDSKGQHALDNATLLSMFDFIGENKRFTDRYQQVKQQLLLEPQPLRMGIQTHIYRSR